MCNRYRRRWTALTLLSFSSLFACGGAPRVEAVSPTVPSDALAATIPPAHFPARAHALLLTQDRSQETKLELAGVVQYQLTRAAKLFERGYSVEGEDAVTGALLLLRHDDELLSATRGQGEALLQAAHAAARSGDGGRAQALYELTLRVHEDPAVKADVQQHLEALDAFRIANQGKSALERIGEQTREDLARSVVDPSSDTYLKAKSGLVRWMHAAVSSRALEDGGEAMTAEQRDIALEAYRAFRTGAPAMIALNLRQGTPAAAVTALEDAQLGAALQPGIKALLEATTKSDSAEAWMTLFRQFDDQRNQPEPEASFPRYVTDAAAFWAAVSLYRASPGPIEHAMPLGMTLVEFGMPEVASSLLSQNSDAETSADALSWSVTLVLRGLLELSRTDQLEAARRSYSAAKPLFQRAETLPPEGPHPARAQALMAALETRHGFAKRALPLLQNSVKLHAEPGTELRLSRLFEQAAKPKEALRHASRAVEIAQESGDLLNEARAEETLFRLFCAQDDTKRAAAALERALRRILVLRDMELPTVSEASVERQLGSILEYYGATHEVQSAYRRALVASRTSYAEIEITLTDMARAGLTLGDFKMTAEAVKSALDKGLPAENAVYIALWHQLALGRNKKPNDGLSHQVFSQALDATGWLHTLKGFGLGEVKASDLTKHARRIPEKTEARFYQAMSSGHAVDRKTLLSVADSPAVDLIEVRIASDLTIPDDFALPSDIVLP